MKKLLMMIGATLSLAAMGDRAVNEDVTLAADADWSADGLVTIKPDARINLAGHTLKAEVAKDKDGNWKIVFHARDPGSFERYVYTADAKFVTKDGHPWIDVGEFQPCLLVSVRD